MTHSISHETHTISVGSILNSTFSSYLNEHYKNAKKIILVDENTQQFCLEYLITSFDVLKNAEIIAIPAGEENKTLEICTGIWGAFTDYHINRNDILINLGGGLVTDLGGFVASIFKRGIDFINIPTSLLAMVDASTGSKTGIDFENYKNQLGVFADPKMVICDPIFLKTLPDIEFLSGKAEMLKHGVINSKKHWNEVKQVTPASISADLIFNSLKIKYDIVQKDPKEKNIRKKLNVGHTIGHAVESFLLQNNKQAHGICVAWGILAEARLAFNSNQLNEFDFEEIKHVISSCYPEIKLNESDFDILLNYMKNDKKNDSDELNFNLITAIGKVEINASFNPEEIRKSLTQTFL